MDNDTKLRPLYLAKILYEQTDENHFLTTAQLMKILDSQYNIKVHRQTIKADIELLIKFGMKIDEVKSTQNRYYIYARMFDPADLKILIDALASFAPITSEKRDELLGLIANLASKHSAESLQTNIISKRQNITNVDELSIINVINQAINEGKKISFQCFSFNVKKEKKLLNKSEPYVLTPLYLLWNGDFHCVVGVCDGDQSIRSFRIDRIINIPIIMKEIGVPTPNYFNINEYVNVNFRLNDSEIEEVELVCDNDVMDSVIERFGENVRAYANDMNSFRIIVDVAVNHVFYSWIFGFGGKVKIKSPSLISEEYRKMLYEAIEAERD